jgi:hypothetical protein
MSRRAGKSFGQRPRGQTKRSFYAMTTSASVSIWQRNKELIQRTIKMTPFWQEHRNTLARRASVAKVALSKEANGRNRKAMQARQSVDTYWPETFIWNE